MFNRLRIILRVTVGLVVLVAALTSTGCFGGISGYGNIDGYVYYHADARGTTGGDTAKPEMIVTRLSTPPVGYLPLSGAKVLAVQAGRITYSSSSGYFILTTLSPGAYDVSITHERFINGLTYPGVQVVADRTTHLGQAKLGSFFYLIIGINDYPDSYNDLHYAVADADLLESTLWGINGYAGEVVKLTDGQATKAGIRAAIEAIGREMSEYGQDYFVMTFSGHGGSQNDPDPEPPDDYWQEYLVASDGQYITDDELTSWIRTYIRTNFCLFIFDSCYSGGMTKSAGDGSVPAWVKDFRPGLSGLARDLNQYGYVVLMASDDHEVSYEDPDLDGGHGVFTYYLCKGISTGGADTSPRNGFITARELFDYVQPRVVSHTEGYLYGVQTPQLYAYPSERADIPIYRVQ